MSLVRQEAFLKDFIRQAGQRGVLVELDCELMIDAGAIITRLLKVTQEGEKVGG